MPNRARWIGAAMTGIAVAILLSAYAVVRPTPVLAAPCCQECEAQESACYAACRETQHGLAGDDTEQSCYQTCDDDLWDEPYGCWRICRLCNSGTPRESTCYTFVIEHQYECNGYNDQGECTSWSLTAGQPGHVAFFYETGNQWCS